VVYAQLANPVPNRVHISSMTKGKTVQAGRYQATRALILELRAPFPQGLGLPYFEQLNGSL